MQSTTDPFLLLKTLILEINKAQDLELALNAVVQTICQHYRWPYGEIWQLDPQTETLRCGTTFYAAEPVVKTSEGCSDPVRFGQLSKGYTFALGIGVPGRVWTSQQWEWHIDVSSATSDVFLRHQEAKDCGIKAAFGVPLIAAGQTLAVLVFFSDQAIPKDSQLVEIIDAISGPVGRLVQQRQFEKQLRDSEARFRAFMNHSSTMFFMKDAQGRFAYVNQPLEKSFNLKPGEVIGKTDHYFLPKEAADQVGKNDLLVLSTNREQSLVEVVPTPDQVDRYWQVVKFPFSDHAGRRFVGGTAFDITQMKQFEQQLIVEKLEQQRINQTLEVAIKSAETANQAKGNFLAMMSHEIRTPMNAMVGMTELLGDTPLNLQQQDFVNVIRTSSNTLLTLINDILDFSKIESNKLDLEIGCLDLYECVEQVLDLFYSQAAEKGLSLTSVIEPASIPNCFEGDAIRLRQVLSNLVSNSVKFTAKGGVSIQVKVDRISGEEALQESASCDYKIQFLIKDTGIGIAEEKISHLFKPFSQVDASITRRYGGTGLGLAISKQLIEMMDGEIDAVSQVGQGSTFRFSIKLKAYENNTNTCADTWNSLGSRIK
ncbi:MAG: ATP-binding protein [Phormidesmis sp.]